MKLSENEQRVLHELVANSRETDTEMSARIGISTTGVGKIRKKLEATGVIRRYLPHISLERLGFDSMLMLTLKVEDTEDGLSLFDSPNLITTLRLSTSERTHLALYAFRNVMYANQFLHSLKRENYGKLEVVEAQVLSPSSLIKPLSISVMLEPVEDVEECDLISKLKG
ncbi:MAG: Lrp/AsnC family transcriptional regulator [Methermicoccaceae archaeon]